MSIMIKGVSATLVLALPLAVAAVQKQIGFKDTPIIPGTPYHVHDGDRPQPPVIDPGSSSTQEQPGRAPSDAVVLFDGTDLSHWKAARGGGPADWIIEDGAMVVRPRSGSILSTDQFGDCQLHLEFATPEEVSGSSQGRGNSGVMFFGRYEIQILDSFENITYPDGQASAIYGQFPPLVNASKGPGQWQSYDILFTAPRFDEDGELVSPAYATVLHNGVVVHNHRELLGPMTYRGLPVYSAHGPQGPILLQDHGNPIRFRNIWVRPIGDYDQGNTLGE